MVGPVYPYLLKHLTFLSLNLTLESSDAALSLDPFGEVIPHATYPLGFPVALEKFLAVRQPRGAIPQACLIYKCP
jgi:hypothetical protein